jgi:hypothetical protein
MALAVIRAMDCLRQVMGGVLSRVAQERRTHADDPLCRHRLLRCFKPFIAGRVAK